MKVGSVWVGLRRLDRERGWNKGTAFRAFKHAAGQLLEGRDYRLLHHERDRAEISALKESGEIYPASINAVLLSVDAANRLAPPAA